MNHNLISLFKELNFNKIETISRLEQNLKFEIKNKDLLLSSKDDEFLNLLSAEYNRVFFSKIWTNTLTNDEIISKNQIILKVIQNEKKPLSILDIGCGFNRFREYFSENEFLGIDPNFREADIKISFEDFLKENENTFNVIICQGSLHFGTKEFVEERLQQINDKLLRPNGLLFIRFNMNNIPSKYPFLNIINTWTDANEIINLFQKYITIISEITLDNGHRLEFYGRRKMTVPKNKNIFLENSEFINQDNRSERLESVVTATSLFNRCEAFLPDVSGKKILDLGCCIGAMGHWCLTNGATHYTGIEVQEKYAVTAQKLLGEHHNPDKFIIKQTDILSFLENNKENYDIIIVIGVIYAFVNIFDVIKKITSICNDEIIIDSLNTLFDYNYRPVIEILEKQKINNSLDIQKALSGVGVRPTEEALKIIFSLYEFPQHEKIIPKAIENFEHDAYNDLVLSPNKPIKPTRFAYRFIKTKKDVKLYELNDILVNGLADQTQPLITPTFIKAGSWEFNEEVAKRFYQEALNNIPDYVKTITLLIDTVKQKFKNSEDLLILDVGSAIGYTIDRLLKAGFKNVYGSESSQDMITNSNHLERIYFTSHIPFDKRWDVIIINWTLHFINSKLEFLKEIYNSLPRGGMLFLTDKMTCENIELNKAYYDFKIDRGMTIEDIENKKKAIEGILTTKPLSWYIITLSEIGFKDINIENSRFMFNTITARK